MGVPSGTVTFLFTDIEGSTRLWDSAPDAMRAALERHDSILRSAIEGHEGYVFSTGGDGFAAAFARVGEAVAAAVEAQRGLMSEMWPEGAPLRVRMGLHTGEAAERDGDYFGSAVNRAARLMATANGGQVVCSRVDADLASGLVVFRSLGEHRLRDLAAAEQVFQVGDDVFSSAPVGRRGTHQPADDTHRASGPLHRGGKPGGPLRKRAIDHPDRRRRGGQDPPGSRCGCSGRSRLWGRVLACRPSAGVLRGRGSLSRSCGHALPRRPTPPPS